MDWTYSGNGEIKTIPVEHTNGVLDGTFPVALTSVKRIAPKAPAGSSQKEVNKQKAEKINYDLFEQIAVERSEIAFSEFYDRFAPKVYAMLLRLVRAEEDALDLLQEVFILIWNKAPSLYNIHGNPVPWLIQLARNRAMDEMKSRKYKSRRKDESYDSVRHDLVADDQTPEANFVMVEARAEIQNAMSALSTPQRKAIEMVFFGGMTRQEAADSLQIPHGSIGAIIRQAVLKLGVVLKPRMGLALPANTKLVHPKAAQPKEKKRSDRSTSVRWKKNSEIITDLKDEGIIKWKTEKDILEMDQPPAKKTPAKKAKTNGVARKS